MASIVLGVVGAVVGSFFGVPQIGWAIGSAVGGSMTTQSLPTMTSTGPQIGDLRVQQSSWGTVIPIIYGRFRVAGNGIWYGDFKETKHVNSTTSSGGGKGGGVSQTTTSTTYTYTVDLAMGLCAGPIVGISKIWANGEIIYNRDSTISDTSTISNSTTFADKIHIYLGDETQLPDSWIESYLGVGNVPAYRGLSYIVFKNLELESYGNRIPQLEFEVVTTGTNSLGYITYADTNLGFIIKNICNKAGLLDTEIDTTNLNSTTLIGYGLTRPASAVYNILPLQKIYPFIVSDTDGKIIFKTKNTLVSLEIPHDDILPDSLTINRANEESLPNKIALKFINSFTYNLDVEVVRRLITKASTSIQEEIPVLLTPSLGIKAAEYLLFLLQYQRTTINFKTSNLYIDIEPNDLIIINTLRNRYIVRIIKKTSDNSTISFESITEPIEEYIPILPSSNTNTTSVELISSNAEISHIFIDCPLLSINNLDTYSSYHGVYKTTSGNLKGADIYSAPTLLEMYNKISSNTNTAIVGVTTSILNMYTGGNFIDEGSSVDIDVGITGQLSSISIDMLNLGYNLCILNNEIMQFKEAIQLSPGIYRISSLVRYLRGTDYLKDTNHPIGSTFVLLDLNSITLVEDNILYRNALIDFKAVPFYTNILSAPINTKANTGLSKKPFKPVHEFANFDSTSTLISWERQARLDSAWNSFRDVPLIESLEQYEIDIVTTLGVVKRTLISNTTSVSYTHAEQIVDFGTSSGNTFYIKIYQISSIVGRGWPAIITFTN